MDALKITVGEGSDVTARFDDDVVTAAACAAASAASAAAAGSVAVLKMHRDVAADEVALA